MSSALQMDKPKELLKLFYAGQQIPSPNDGFLMLLGVRAQDDGSALALFECSVSSLRYQVVIPKATRTERKKVKDVLDSGSDLDCPRCGDGHRLARSGQNFACARCGVPFAKV